MTKEKFPAMLSHKFQVRRIKEWPVAVEPKLDGVRAIIILKHIDDEYEISTWSRAGKPFTSVEAVEDAIMDTFAETGWTEDMVFDGELFCGDFATTVSQIKKKKEQAPDAVYTIFDMLPLSEWADGESTLDFDSRRAKLYEFFQAKASIEKRIKMSKAVLCDNIDEIQEQYAKARAARIEGVIVKAIKGEVSRWVGKRSYGWMKIKEKNTADCKIIGAVEGQGKFEHTLGNLEVEYDNGKNVVIVGVGTGLSDKQRQDLWRLHRQGKLAGLVAEVSYHEETPDGNLRHPVFESIRIDK